METLTRLRVERAFTKDQIDKLVGFAIHCGFMREEPRKRWSEKERKEAARYGMERIIHFHLVSKENK